MATNTTTVKAESDSIVLKKDSKGNFAWEIKVYGDSPDSIINKIESANNRLQNIGWCFMLLMALFII